MLFLSTDFPYFNTTRISDVVVKCDDTEYPIAKPSVMADNQGNMYVELVNIYNTSLAPLDCTMPKDSITITFTISSTGNVPQ